MKHLAGTASLVRFILRRDRLVLPAWVAAFTIVPAATLSAFAELYPTDAAVETAARALGGNPAFRAMFGPVFEANLGSLTAWRASIVLVIVGVATLLTVIRHTRVEEETGRRELLGSTVVGRHAPLTATLMVAFGANALLAMLVASGLAAQGQPITGSVAFGLSMAAVGMVFASVGAFAAQITEGAGGARAIGLSVLGLAYVLRAAGDAGGSGLTWLSWLSPIGWAQRMRPFASEQWWVLGLLLGLAGLVTVAAFSLSARRDIGSGVIAPRPGPAEATGFAGTPLGLAWRIHRGLIVGWAAGFAVLGSIYGGVAEGVGDLLKDNPELLDVFERLGGGAGTIIDLYLAGVMGVLGLIAAAYAVQAALRMRVEEESQRLEPVLATSVGRKRWMAGHLLLALGGPALALTAAGLAVGATYGAVSGDLAGQVPRVLSAALAQLPAVWVLAGLAVALFGLLPRLSSLAWAGYGAVVFITLIGALLMLGQWFNGISPFNHLPNLPGGEAAIAPLVGLTGIGVLLVVSGVIGFGRRDIG